jgi:hypothetical protein
MVKIRPYGHSAPKACCQVGVDNIKIDNTLGSTIRLVGNVEVINMEHTIIPGQEVI